MKNMIFIIDKTRQDTKQKSDVPVAVSKAAGLLATTPNDITIPANLTAAKSYTFDLTAIGLNKSDTTNKTYTLKSDGFTDANYIFTAGGEPAVSGSALNYTAAAGKAANLTATQVITISSDNYANVDVTITFKTVPKKQVDISGVIVDSDKEYDDTPIDVDSDGIIITENTPGDKNVLADDDKVE